MRIYPECRFCGTRVQFFGQICGPCESDGNENFRDDPTVALERADRWEMLDRQDRNS